MTNEEAAAMLESMKNYFLPTSPMLEERREITAIDLAISALSKHSASGKQADKKLFDHGYWILPGEVFIGHNVLNEVLNTIIKSMDTEQRKIDSILTKTDQNDEAPPDSDQIADGSKMVDQFRDSTKMTEDVPDTNVGKIPYKKPEIIKYERHYDHTDCIWYRYLGEEEPNKCPSTCSQYRDGWNDAMDYIFCNGKGYQPYKRKA